jgi:hypothetical protein
LARMARSPSPTADFQHSMTRLYVCLIKELAVSRLDPKPLR